MREACRTTNALRQAQGERFLSFVGWVPHLYPRGGNASAWVKTAFTQPTKNKSDLPTFVIAGMTVWVVFDLK